MTRTIRCRLVSPEQSLFDGAVEYFIAPAWDGEIGILPRHAPLVARLGVGMARLHVADGGVERFAIRGGLLRVKDDDAVLLVTDAIHQERTDRYDLERRLDEVLDTLAQPLPQDEYQRLNTERDWLKLRIAQSE